MIRSPMNDPLNRKFVVNDELDLAKYAVTDHNEAAADLLQHYVDELRAGEPREKVGKFVTLLGRMMEGRT